MPWKLVAPHTRTDGKIIKFYYVRGEYLGHRINDSTGTSEARAAARILALWRKQAERGEFRRATSDARPLTFVAAATAYMRAGGDGQHLLPIIDAWPQKLAQDVDQIAVDLLAEQLYPKATAATRNRQVYTPISAVLKRAGIEKKIKRPKGWRGNRSMSWLEPDQAFALIGEAYKIEAEFGLFCFYLLYTGERLGEALRAELRHLQLHRQYLYLPDSKTGVPRGVYLPAWLVEAFRAQPPRERRMLIERGQKGFIAGGGGREVQDAGVPFLERRPDAKLFRFHDGGALRDMLKDAMTAAGLSFPRRQGGFHIFCHTYGSWMHRFGKLDRHGLARTGRWKDPDSADGYVHTQESEEARRADLLPAPTRRQVVDIKTRSA